MRIKRLMYVALSILMIMTCMCISVFAEQEKNNDSLEVGWSIYSQTIANDTLNNGIAKVSYGLDVLSAQNGMAVAGIKGNVVNLSADKFACAMNLSKIKNITITALPDAVCGSLYLGSSGVSVGQTISAENLSMLTYEEASSGKGQNASFKFTVNENSYETTCNIYMLDKINYSPTISLASYASLNRQTYKGVNSFGVLSAYDPEGDKMTFEIINYPKNGYIKLTDKNNGSYVYTAYDGYSGKDSFSYVVRDVYGNYSASATVNIEITAPSTSTVYSDLYGSDIHNYAITMTERGTMNGIRVGNSYYFEPDREVSRVDFLVTAMTTLGISNVPDADKVGFYDDSDISDAQKGYVALAYSMGYISGIKENGEIYFKPNEIIKFDEAAVILSNIIGYADSKVTTVFADNDKIADWSSRAIYSLHTLGILETADNISGADKNITRGEMAKLLCRAAFVAGK